MINKIYEKIKEFIKNNYKILIAFILFLFISFYELPFVIYSPGGIVPLGERIEIDGEYNEEGSLNMCYVTTRKATIVNWILEKVIPNWDMEKETESEYDFDELIEIEKLYLDNSITNATILAYEKANKKISIKSEKNTISYVDPKADTNVEVLDELIKVDDKIISSIDELREVVASHKVGDIVKLTVKENGKEKEKSAKVYETDDGLRIGIGFMTTYDLQADPVIDVKTKANESGSSGGLMLSLQIYNKLISEDITKGKKIVGTGTITRDGIVGEIDGIKYKLLGAKKNKADLFFCPKENYDEAIKVNEKYKLDLKIVSVDTFDDALNYLKNELN